jgi:inorganic pyrophosphatase
MNDYFFALQSIVDSSTVNIDRPKGSAHPRYPDYIYPLDYGFLDGSQSQAGGGIDVWCGTGDVAKISGVLLIADPVKRDSEIKILLGCDDEEMKLAEECSNRGDMKAFLIERIDK